MHEIRKPFFIMHEIPSGKAECIIAGPPDAGVEIFGLLIADLIGHVARAKGCAVVDVVEWVNKELKHPTTKLTQTNLN